MPKAAHFVRVNNVINRVFDRYEKNWSNFKMDCYIYFNCRNVR
jgi:hypothetical protein